MRRDLQLTSSVSPSPSASFPSPASFAALNMLSMKSVFDQSCAALLELLLVVVGVGAFAASLTGEVREDDVEMVGGDEVGGMDWGGGASGDRINVGGPPM